MSLEPSVLTPSIWGEPEPVSKQDVANLHPNQLIATLLFRRGIRTPEAASAFVDSARQPPPPPFSMPNMREAVDRVTQAITSQERVGIFGDYDADGITATAILSIALGSAIGKEQVATFLPTRADGYGLNHRGIDELRATGATLIIVVDCGSNDHASVAYAQEQGADVVILDHHRMSGPGPTGAITVSAQLDSDSTYHDLAAAGIAWLLVAALAMDGVPMLEHFPGGESELLDLAAIGTIGDVSSVTGTNRAIVRDGLAVLRSTRNLGLRAMIRTAQVDATAITAHTVGFILAPRLNAPGRLADPQPALDLLLTTDPAEAQSLAMQIEQANDRRKARTVQIQQEAHAQIAQLEDWEDRPLFVLSSPDWDAGLVGLVASRLVEQFNRPAILLAEGDGIATGSARSVEGVNIVDVFASVGEILERSGGHAAAGGLTMHVDRLAEAEAGMMDYIFGTGIDLPLPRQIQIDANLPPQAINPATVEALRALEPFGINNEEPIFRVQGARVRQVTTMGREQQHLKIQAHAGHVPLEAVIWNEANRSRELVGVSEVDLAGTLEVNAWNGRQTMQLKLKDFRPTQ